MLAHAQRHLARRSLAGMVLLFAAAAHAQISYVGPTGDDDNPCTRAIDPCRSLQRGINVAPEGGDVRVLGSGEYGSATIAKSLTISGNGPTVAVGQITIDNASAVVALRGLNLVGVGHNDFGGVAIFAASAVHIERCTVAHFTMHGIYATAQNLKLFVTDSIMRDNGADGLLMFYSNASFHNQGTMTLTFDKSHAENNGGDGVLLRGGVSTFIRSSFSGNHANGISLSNGPQPCFRQHRRKMAPPDMISCSPSPCWKHLLPRAMTSG